MVEPKIPKLNNFLTKKCSKCLGITGIDDFCKTRSIFYPDGRLPICNGCVEEYLEEKEFDWKYVNKVCQWADIPFVAREWVRLGEMNGLEHTWGIYSRIFENECYEDLGWEDYFRQYKELKEKGLIEEEIPEVKEEKWRKLRERWGENYDDSEIRYLEELYKGLLISQNVNGALQTDQAFKLCKLSLEVDSRIRAGDKDVDKFLASYDKLVKIAEFTPKNSKNASDFDSFGELAVWLEKHGKVNKFYDGTTRDVIDETLKNIQNYNQKLYVNEGGLGDEITERIEALKRSDELEESTFGTQTEFDLDNYEIEGYEVEEFNPGGGDGTNTII